MQGVTAPARAEHGGAHAPAAGPASKRRKGKIGLQTDVNRKNVALTAILRLAKMGPQGCVLTVEEWMEDRIPKDLVVGAYQR